MSLNIGREPGTWMPSDWGLSGQRLRLDMNIIFSEKQLYERETFLSGIGGAKILKVVNNEGTLGPSITQGARKFRVKDGAWRIGRGDGPKQTDLLRFYVEIEEQLAHSDSKSDVYVPAGRIYMTAGYFPHWRNKPREKDVVTGDIQRYETRYQKVAEERDSESNPFSINKLRLTRDLVKIRSEIDMLNARLADAQVTEPDSNLLSMTARGDAGLTKGGGVCCRVIKGRSYEYHILGRVNLASVKSNTD